MATSYRIAALRSITITPSSQDRQQSSFWQLGAGRQQDTRKEH